MKKFLLLSLLSCSVSLAQDHSHKSDRAISFPDITGYRTLKTDLHIHSVFSDGNVWPTIRVLEAVRDDLDAIALTEHLEYQPHKEDIPHPDRNRAHEVALEEAKDHDLLLIRGSEITRSEPVGHNNAIFLKDANPLLIDDAPTVFQEANKQGAFVFWNHPAWYAQSPNGNPVWTDFQAAMVKNGKLHGIEVINSVDYSEEALNLALEHNLAIMGTSDIHGLIDWDYNEKGKSRPVTLVFSKEKSETALRDALFAGRTVAAYTDILIGKSEFLNPLLQASICVIAANYIKDTQVLRVHLKNNCSSDLLLQNAMPYNFYNEASVFELPARGEIILLIKTLKQLSKLNLSLTALKCYTAPKKNPTITWEVNITQ